MPLGVSWIQETQAFNFAVFSEHAESVTLLLYTSRDFVNPSFSFRFDFLKNKSGPIWHCRIPAADLGDARYYAFSVSGPNAPPGHRFDPQKILMDPYSTCVFFPPAFDRAAAMREGSNAGQAPLGVIAACCETFDWTGDVSPRHQSDAVIYEMHVKGFTKNPASGVSARCAGTYQGLIEKIPYLSDLGVTVVELMPVFERDPQASDYWGYMPLNFFAPHYGYGCTGDLPAQHREFRSMVKALHRAGIEVVLDVVYNHTCEGNQRGPVYSYKGLDTSEYYMLTEDPSNPYLDYTGTGNTLNFDRQHVQQMVLDSLRYWRQQTHVDGFRFDLASVFTRNADGSLNLLDPPILGGIASDPDLADVRLIAEPWDAAGAYQLGRAFPGITWLQWNGRFRDDIRRFVRGDPGMVPSLMQRLYGSDDYFPDDRLHAYHSYQSVNYVTCHDGFTLYDLVSYNEKRNWANGEDNRDGMSENYSWNCGYEGDDGVPAEVISLRRRQVKNCCCLLMLSNGTPMLRAGDEFLNTQHGNNNPYNQDNALSWLDWDRHDSNPDIFRFFKKMIAFRKGHPTLGRSRFWREDVRWYGVGRLADLSYDSHSIAFYLDGKSQRDDDLYVMINAYWEKLTFTIQEGTASEWKRMIDTGLPSPDDFSEAGVPLPSPGYTVSPRAIAVFLRPRRD